MRAVTGSRPDGHDVYLTLRRTIRAPVETVYAAWTDPEILRRWLAPGEAIVGRAAAEATVGGAFLVEMRGTEGQTWTVRGRYREVVLNRRLAFTWRWDAGDGESLVTVELEPDGDGATRLTLTHSRFADAGTREEHERGWAGCLAKLEGLYAG